jgi:hypothetical protein
MKDNFKHYLTIWSVFFLIAMGLGYQGLTRYDPAESNLIDDSKIYSEIVKNNTQGITLDHRSTRVLVPFIAIPIYHFSEGMIGSWNRVQFSLLVVSAFFCSLIVILMVNICEYLFKDRLVGILAGLLFFVNFTIPNLYLSGLVDSAEAFFLLLLVYSMLRKNWLILPFIAILGSLTKETFLPSGFIIITVWYLYDAYHAKNFYPTRILMIVLFVFISVVILTLLKSYSYGEYTSLLGFTGDMHKVNNFDYDRILVAIRRFLYSYIWLAPLAFFRLHIFPIQWTLSIFLAAITIFIMGWWIGASGAAISRYMFNILGPLLCISAAVFVINSSKLR